jgi:hypothetical protein
MLAALLSKLQCLLPRDSTDVRIVYRRVRAMKSNRVQPTELYITLYSGKENTYTDIKFSG